MTVEIDPEARRAVHVESGLAVEWVRDEPAQERKSHFKIVFNGKEIPFEASFDAGEKKIKEKFPEITPKELSRKLYEILESNYRCQNISGDFDREIFVNTWQMLLSSKYAPYKISTYYSEWKKSDLSDIKKWSSER